MIWNVVVLALPRHQTAHAALLADILDVLHGSSPAARDQPPLGAEERSPGELRVAISPDELVQA